VTALAELLLLVILICALERAHRRRTGPWPPLAGSSDVTDRDAERLRSDLRTAPEPPSFTISSTARR
jgi:hypothetical protein